MVEGTPKGRRFWEFCNLPHSRCTLRASVTPVGLELQRPEGQEL